MGTEGVAAEWQCPPWSTPNGRHTSAPTNVLAPLANGTTPAPATTTMANSSAAQIATEWERIAASALRSTHDQMRSCVSIDLLPACQREVNFLRMIDRKAPVLYERGVVENAIRRYESCWLPAQAAKPDLNNIPPLDVHWVWHVHMLSPLAYREDSVAICGTVVDHKLLSADEIQQRYEQSVSAWNEFCPDEPYDFLLSSAKPYQQKSKYDIAEAVQRQRNFNYQVSLPHFTAPRFLSDAIDRYINFLQLKQTYSDIFLTPCYDFDIIWHTHQVHPADYHRDCIAIFGSLLKHDDSVNDRAKGSKLLRGEAITKKAWSAHFKESFWRRGCMYRGHVAPSFLGFEPEDNLAIAYGHVHIPSIALKEIPVQREQLRLKLSYGGKKISTFNADLWDKQVTRSSFSLVWQPNSGAMDCPAQGGGCGGGVPVGGHQNGVATPNGQSSASSSSSTSTGSSSSASTNPGPVSSIVKFPFDRKCPKELLVELELYDKVFLHKRDVIRLRGRLALEQLLPTCHSKVAQSIIQMPLESANGERARMNVTAR